MAADRSFFDEGLKRRDRHSRLQMWLWVWHRWLLAFVCTVSDDVVKGARH